jgi:hypothetical protein
MEGSLTQCRNEARSCETRVIGGSEGQLDLEEGHAIFLDIHGSKRAASGIVSVIGKDLRKLCSIRHCSPKGGWSRKQDMLMEASSSVAT